MADDRDVIQLIRSQTLELIQQITAQPKPSYELDGSGSLGPNIWGGSSRSSTGVTDNLLPRRLVKYAPWDLREDTHHAHRFDCRRPFPICRST